MATGKGEAPPVVDASSLGPGGHAAADIVARPPGGGVAILAPTMARQWQSLRGGAFLASIPTFGDAPERPRKL